MKTPWAKLDFRCDARSVAICLLLIVVVAWAFLPALRNPFCGYDDGYYVTPNSEVPHEFTWKGVGWAFRSIVAANWYPLTILSHMLDWQFYGSKPWGHHFTSVLLHAVNTVLLFWVFRRMTGACWRSAVLAALFALHPLRVESVAWVAERKDVLSTLFWLLTMWAYARYAEKPVVSNQCSVTSSQTSGVTANDHGPQTTDHGSPINGHRSLFYLLSLSFFTLGLMSKPMLVSLPFVLLLLDYWPLNRLELNTQHSRLRTLLPLIWEKTPFFMLAAIFSVVTYLVQRSAGAVVTDLALGARWANALVAYLRYLGKFFWPTNLAVFYPHPQQWPVGPVLAAAGLLLAILVVLLLLARKRPYLAFGWLWFWGTLVPVIGLVQVGHQSMADRYTYVPMIGLVVMLVWGGYEVACRWRYGVLVSSLLAVAATLACTTLTRRQLRYWQDDETLWRHAASVTEYNDVAWFNLGFALAARGAFDAAIHCYEQAVQISPVADDAHRSLAYALFRKGKLAEAIQEYELVLRLNPKDAEAHNNLGHILAQQGQLEEASRHLIAALRLKPDYPEAHDNLGSVLATRRRYAEAAAAFREVLRLKPDYPGVAQKLERALAAQRQLDQALEPYRQALKSKPGDAQAHGNLGRVLLEAGQLDEAIEQCAEAARLDPKNAEIQYHLGVALSRKGEGEKAARQFELALELDPKLAAAHYALGIIYKSQRRMAEALKHWREAARLAPQWPEPLNNLAWALATSPQPDVRDGVEAVKLATRALELTGTNNVGVLDTLGAAYAEAGRFAEAVASARRAQAAAAAQGQAVLAEQIQLRLALYNSGRPYQEGEPSK